jgi:four helix bundle protein
MLDVGRSLFTTRFKVEHRTSNTERRMGAQGSDMAQGTGGGQYDLEERLLAYSVGIIRLVDELPNTRTGNHVAGQLLRSGTSPSSNYAEAQSAESPDDFVHKMRICLKELRETKRWLPLIRRAPLVKSLERTDTLLRETEELIKIFVRSVRTAEASKKG